VLSPFEIKDELINLAKKTSHTRDEDAAIGGDDRCLNAELVGRTGFALPDALHHQNVEGIRLRAALVLLLRADFVLSNAATQSRLPIRGSRQKRNRKVPRPQTTKPCNRKSAKSPENDSCSTA
jgi:hypothetical protein